MLKYIRKLPELFLNKTAEFFIPKTYSAIQLYFHPNRINRIVGEMSVGMKGVTLGQPEDANQFLQPYIDRVGITIAQRVYDSIITNEDDIIPINMNDLSIKILLFHDLKFKFPGAVALIIFYMSEIYKYPLSFIKLITGFSYDIEDIKNTGVYFYPGTWKSLIENPKTDIKEWVLSQKDIMEKLGPSNIKDILWDTKNIEFTKLALSQEDIV